MEADVLLDAVFIPVSRLDIEGVIFVAVALVIGLTLFGARRPPGRCPRCGENNREAARFCSQCGLRLPGR